VASWMFATCALAQAPLPWTATLRVRVLDERGAPLAGVGAAVGQDSEITSEQALRQPKARTDAAGWLQFELHGDGTAAGSGRQVVVLAPPQRLAVRIDCHAEPAAPVLDCGTLFLPPARARHGRVRAADGRPLAGVRVEARAEVVPLWVQDGHGSSLAAVA